MTEATVLQFPEKAKRLHPAGGGLDGVSDVGATVWETTGGPMPHLSFSQLDEYETCPRKYQAHRIEKLEPMETSGAALGGSAVHRVVESMELDRTLITNPEAGLTVAEMFIEDFRARIAAVDQEKAPLSWGGKVTQKWPEGETQAWWESTEVDKYGWFTSGGAKMLQKYAEIRRQDAKEGISLITFPCNYCGATGSEGGAKCDFCGGTGNAPGFEARVRATIKVRCVRCDLMGKVDPKCERCGGKGETEHSVLGFIDSLVGVKTVPGKGLVRLIRDVKTGGSVQFLKPMQLVVYRKLVKLAVGWDIDLGQFLWLRGKDRTSQVREHDLSVYPEDFVEVTYADHLKGVEAGIFPVRPGGLCGSCGFRTSCTWGSVQPEKELAE